MTTRIVCRNTTEYCEMYNSTDGYRIKGKDYFYFRTVIFDKLMYISVPTSEQRSIKKVIRN